MSDSPKYHIRQAAGEQFGPAAMDLLLQWAREGRVPRDATLVPVEGGEPINVMDCPELAAIVGAPPTVKGELERRPSSGDEGMAMVIPYRNPHALTGYYLAVGSLIPVIGVILGPIAIALGIMGLRKRKADPRIHGLAHAIVAIVLGAVGMLISTGCAFGLLMPLLYA